MLPIQTVITQMLYKKSTNMTLNSKQNRQKAQSTERRKTSFLKEFEQIQIFYHLQVFSKDQCKTVYSCGTVFPDMMCYFR